MAITECSEQGLYYRQWAAANGTEQSQPKAVIMLVHGLGEHCQRYDKLAQYLNTNGYTVSAMDLPNHGRSEGQRGHVDSFSLFQDAALGLHARIKEAYPDIPIFLLGHSMGGLISARFLIDHQDKFKGALLSGAAIESPQTPPAWQVGLMKFIAKLFPKVGMLELDGNLVSRDQKVVDAYIADPLINDKKLSAQLLVEFFKTMDEVKQGAKVINLPMLIMHGTADGLTAPSGSQWLHDSIASSDKTLTLYDGLFHEIFNEPEAHSIYAEVVGWLDQR